MKYFKLLYLAFGFSLLAIILHDTDIKGVWLLVRQIGWGGITFVLVLYFLAFLTDVGGWQLTLMNIPLNLRWLYRLFLVRMVGEAFNRVTPLASMGGEPVKAIMLKNYYRMGYRESGVSLVLSRTIDLIGLVVFLCVGFSLLLTTDALSSAFKTLAGLGLFTFSLAIALFFLFQRFQFMSVAGSRLSRLPFGRKLASLMHLINDTDEQLVHFYTLHKWRFRNCLILSFLNWPLGVVEVYYVMSFLGHPITFKDAWIIESMTQLVRNGLFFIPSSIGTQEGTFLLIVSAIAGDRNLGLALSLVRRFREIIWIVIGLGLWWLFSFKPSLSDRSRF